MSGSQQPLLGYGASAYRIANSLRFRSSASAYLSRTFGVAGNRKTWTWSGWVKRGNLSNGYALIATTSTSTPRTFFVYDTDALWLLDQPAGTNASLTTSAVFRDPSAWYHVVLAVDTTQATSTNRVKIYVNGVQQTVSGTYPTQNTDMEINKNVAHTIGSYSTNYFDGYLTDINFIDGQALTPSSFGAFNATTGVWGPKSYTGTYGTNGFKLNFSNGTSTTTLGYDLSGNGNNWTTNNISLTAGSTYDWMLDSPTPYQGSSYGVGNYCTLNSLVPGASALSNGNLTSAGSTVYPTIQPTSGNWYFEINGVAQNWTPPAAFPTGTGDFNFGQRPFASTPTSGYKSLCTYNLPTPTIQNGAGYMAATLYTGTSSSQSISNTVNGISFQPDFIWAKQRGAATDHVLYDSIRTGTYSLTSNNTAADVNQTSNGCTVTFASSGFTAGADNAGYLNYTGRSYVGWQWKAGGTAVTNTAGSITSSVSANTTSGFSVVTYTGTGVAGTIGHGLGVAPAMIIIKRRDAVGGWPVYHAAFGNTGAGYLNGTGAWDAPTSAYWNNTTPSSSVVTVNNNAVNNASGGTYVAYCFAAIPGYSAFGSYTGNGSADGAFIYTGFLPRLILVKCSSTTGNWFMLDTARNTYNVIGEQLEPNLSNAGSTITTLDVLSNGFKMRTSSDPNASQTYVYAAFAANPFTNSLAF